jgi:RNA polymerase-binding protein DksA
MANFEEFYQNLKKEQARLQHELKQLRGEMKSAGEEREEEATEAFELEKSMALERRFEDALAEVGHAISKYEAGTYGVCDLCGAAIAPARLEALPQASLCLECKARQTKGGRNKSVR